MRIAISNIAWDPFEDDAVADLLNTYDIDAIDVAPPKYFPVPREAAGTDIDRVRQWWSDRGIEITGMQSLLFGTTGLNLFGQADSRRAMLDHLDSVCRIGAGLGATRLVFGSPKNRDRMNLTDAEVDQLSSEFFRQLGDVAQAHGVTICLEPNPSRYGCNFMTLTEETAHVVRQVAHPAIRMQLDIGALAINGEQPARMVADYAPLIGHIHASEPDLVPLGDGGSDHRGAAAAISAALPDHVVSIEMVATKQEPHLEAIERAIQIATTHYRLGSDARQEEVR